MPEEKHTKTSVGVGNTEINRETKSRQEGEPGDDRPRYRGEYRDYRDRDRGEYDDDYNEGDDYGYRARRSGRELGDSIADAGRNVRRQGTDLVSTYCNWLGGIFIGIGNALSGGQGSEGGSSYGCGNVQDACGGNAPPPRYQQGGSSGGGGARVSSSRTEIRRTSSR